MTLVAKTQLPEKQDKMAGGSPFEINNIFGFKVQRYKVNNQKFPTRKAFAEFKSRRPNRAVPEGLLGL